MPLINVGQENSGSIDLYYEDHGSGVPVVLVHGWPLSGASWEKQVPVLMDAGHRVITYDRRGFGRSGRPAVGYNFDTLAEDVHKLVTALDLRDFTLVGFSTGGGEVARYLGKYGSDRVSSAVFVSAIPPFLLKGPDNPEGIDGSVFDQLMAGLVADRPATLSAFLADFFSFDVLGGKLVSDQAVQSNWNIAADSSPIGTLGCSEALSSTDFHGDLAKIAVPTMVVHGDADRICPIAATGLRTHAAVKGSRLVVIKDGPHGIPWTHAEEVNRELLNFLAQPAQAKAA